LPAEIVRVITSHYCSTLEMVLLMEMSSTSYEEVYLAWGNIQLVTD